MSNSNEQLCNLTQSLVKALDLVMSAHDYAPDEIVLIFNNRERDGQGLPLTVKMQDGDEVTEVTLNLATQKLDSVYGVLHPVAI